jgi:hypothetical protein
MVQNSYLNQGREAPENLAGLSSLMMTDLVGSVERTSLAVESAAKAVVGGQMAGFGFESDLGLV